MAIPESVKKQGEASEGWFKQNGSPEESAAQKAPAPVEVPDEWQQRYNVLKGKYDSEVPELSRQVQELRQLNERLQEDAKSDKEELENLRHQQAQAAEASAKQSASIDASAEALREQGYPDEMIDAIVGAAKAAPSAEIDALKSQLASVAGTLDSVQKQTAEQAQESANNAEERFWTDLDRVAPDNWQQINDDPGFLSWLNEVDPASGATRHQLLQSAREARDANRTAHFFTTWASMNQSAHSDSGLASQASPAEGGGGDITPVGQGQRWAKSEVEKFYRDVRRGSYKGRDEDRMRIERDIFEAQAEGRIY